ncbi:hypothetical protein [Bacillus pumilus]|uniref:hypothetical protein n=1 Tax=Bacillus pumilus TaxID=1408 RepID=UPI00227FD8B2|nr:hypothetical protein [Bacillus pumilus]MCY7500201.1 hypothetical protein [Bacillus pumilus]MCY7528475.1 hypothetical protein [Bacillus pumilus]MED4439567.1 hypothetical protein [Bacillus pumilus]MED4490010.1 hypothetical protein [Bacillus pumilus]
MEYTNHGDAVKGYITYDLYFESFDYQEDSVLEQKAFTTVKELFDMMQPHYFEELKEENNADRIELHDVTFSAKEDDTEAFITMFDNSGTYRISVNLDASGFNNEYRTVLKDIKEIVDRKL